MQKIIPNLWFDTQAEEAVNFYTAIFKNSKIKNVSRYGKAGAEISKMPQGSVMTIEFELAGQNYIALNGGPVFKFNPSVSFIVSCKTKEAVDNLWEKLSPGGLILMELGEYPFSKRFGWLRDKFGLSWQVILPAEEGKEGPSIVPALMFTGENFGKAAEAIKYYVSVFKNSKQEEFILYGPGQEPNREGTVMFAGFMLENYWFAAMDSAGEHNFTFNEAISFIVNCDDQNEIDYYWDKLAPGGDEKAQVCGWLKDKYGLSWQIVPAVISEMLQSKDREKSERAMAAFLKMKKIDISELKKAYDGK